MCVPVLIKCVLLSSLIHITVLCGINNPYGLHLAFFDNGVDQVGCDYTKPDYYQGYPGVAHGGVVRCYPG